MTSKQTEIMSFLQEKVFDPILISSASKPIKNGVNLTITRLKSQKDAAGIYRCLVERKINTTANSIASNDFSVWFFPINHVRGLVRKRCYWSDLKSHDFQRNVLEADKENLFK